MKLTLHYDVYERLLTTCRETATIERDVAERLSHRMSREIIARCPPTRAWVYGDTATYRLALNVFTDSQLAQHVNDAIAKQPRANTAWHEARIAALETKLRAAVAVLES